LFISATIVAKIKNAGKGASDFFECARLQSHRRNDDASIPFQPTSDSPKAPSFQIDKLELVLYSLNERKTVSDGDIELRLITPQLRGLSYIIVYKDGKIEQWGKSTTTLTHFKMRTKVISVMFVKLR